MTASAGWNAQQQQQQRLQQDEYRAPTSKRPRSPTAARSGVADVKKRSSSIERTNARHESRETSNDYYSRTESPNNFVRGGISEQQRFHSGNNIGTSRDFIQTSSQKKPRTPPTPTPKGKRNKTNSSSSDDSSTSLAEGSSNGSSSSSSSDDSSSDIDSVDGATGPTSNEKSKHVDQQKQQPPGPSSSGAAPPSLPSHLNVVNSANGKDPSPDMQKLQRDRVRLLQMLETLDSEDPSCSTRKSDDKKHTPLSEIFDLDWVNKVAKVRKRGNTRSTDAQPSSNNADEQKSASSKSFLCRQTSVDNDGVNGCDGGGSCSKDVCSCEELDRRRAPSVRRTEFNIENIKSMDADDVAGAITAVSHGELLRRSSTLSRKNSRLSIGGGVNDCQENNNNDIVEFNSPTTMTTLQINSLPNIIINKKDSSSLNLKQDDFCTDVLDTKQQTPSSTSAFISSKCDGDQTATPALTVAASTSNQSSSSVPKNELSTPARASLSQKSRKIPLELTENEQLSDPRCNRPKIIIVKDLPIPNFAFKKSSSTASTSMTVHHQSSPLKLSRPELKIETSSSTVTSQVINKMQIFSRFYLNVCTH